MIFQEPALKLLICFFNFAGILYGIEFYRCRQLKIISLTAKKKYPQKEAVGEYKF
jgi:hypothetical protein